MSASMSSIHLIEPLKAPSYDFMGSLRRIGHVFSTESNKPDEPSSACHSISSNLSSTSKFALPKPKPLPENIEPQSPMGVMVLKDISSVNRSARNMTVYDKSHPDLFGDKSNANDRPLWSMPILDVDITGKNGKASCYQLNSRTSKEEDINMMRYPEKVDCGGGGSAIVGSDISAISHMTCILNSARSHYPKENNKCDNLSKEEICDNKKTYYTTELLPVKKYEPESLTWLMPSEANLTDSIQLKTQEEDESEDDTVHLSRKTLKKQSRVSIEYKGHDETYQNNKDISTLPYCTTLYEPDAHLVKEFPSNSFISKSKKSILTQESLNHSQEINEEETSSQDEGSPKLLFNVTTPFLESSTYIEKNCTLELVTDDYNSPSSAAAIVEEGNAIVFSLDRTYQGLSLKSKSTKYTTRQSYNKSNSFNVNLTRCKNGENKKLNTYDGTTIANINITDTNTFKNGILANQKVVKNKSCISVDFTDEEMDMALETGMLRIPEQKTPDLPLNSSECQSSNVKSDFENDDSSLSSDEPESISSQLDSNEIKEDNIEFKKEIDEKFDNDINKDNENEEIQSNMVRAPSVDKMTRNVIVISEIQEEIMEDGDDSLPLPQSDNNTGKCVHEVKTTTSHNLNQKGINNTTRDINSSSHNCYRWCCFRFWSN